MTWTVRFLESARDDLARLDASIRQEVVRAIAKKLTIAPESYGEPLRRELFGFWKLRVGECRVIYTIDRGIVTVSVVKVGLRRDSAVYADMLRLLKRGLD